MSDIRFDDEMGVIFSNGDSMPWPDHAPDADWYALKGMTDRIRELEAQLEQWKQLMQYAGQAVEILEAAGLGKVGTPNTLLAMATEAVTELAAQSKALTKAREALEATPCTKCGGRGTISVRHSMMRYETDSADERALNYHTEKCACVKKRDAALAAIKEVQP